MQRDDNTTEPFQGFLSQEGNEVTVEYYPETKGSPKDVRMRCNDARRSR